MSRWENGRYATPVKLGPELNGTNITNVEAFVSPDERFLFIGAFGRPDSLGSSDVYVSQRDGNRWLTPVNLGPLVNTPAREYSPRLTPDGKRLIFSSERGMTTEVRTSAWTMGEFERKSRSVLNGLGNLYSVPLSDLPAVAAGGR